MAPLFQAINAFGGVDVYLVAGALALARMTGLVSVMPAFTRLGLTGVVQNGIALALGLPLVPMIVGALGGQTLSTGIFAVLIVKELVIGIMIGLVLGVPIWAAEAAGDILDLQRGARSASLSDPSQTGDLGISGTLFALVMLSLFFGSGGLRLTLRTVYDSYAVFPATTFPTFTLAAGAFAVSLLDGIFTMGLMLVVPIMVFMLLSDLLLALVSRAAPHLNVFALSLSVKNLVFAFLIAIYGAFLIKYMGTDLGSLLNAGSEIETLARPPP